MDLLPTQGKIIIVTAPSGAGKTSIVKELLSFFPNLSFSVSAATRAPRANEKDGVDYYFMSVDVFRQKIEADEFAEWQMVYEGKYYGTLKAEVQRIWAEGKTPVLDIDVKGAENVKRIYPNNSMAIFVQPPSIEVLMQRLKGRGTESPETLKARLDKAEFELSFSDKFDKVLVNDNLEKACAEAKEIVGEFLA